MANINNLTVTHELNPTCSAKRKNEYMTHLNT